MGEMIIPTPGAVWEDSAGHCLRFCGVLAVAEHPEPNAAVEQSSP